MDFIKGINRCIFTAVFLFLFYENNAQQALNLTATPQWVNLGDLDVPGTQLTVEALFYRYPGSGPNLFSKHTGPPNVNYLLRPTTFEITTTGSGFNQMLNPFSVQNNTWYHIAGTYDGSYIRYYLNGCMVVEQPWNGGMVQNNLNTAIGNRSDCQCEQFLGMIDEARIWNIARTQAEIEANMTDLPNPTLQTGLLSYHKFEGNLLNAQGNVARNGIAVGAISYAAANVTLQPFALTGASVCSPGVAPGTVTLFTNNSGAVFSSDGVNYTSSNTFTGVMPGTHTFYARSPEGCAKDTTLVVPNQRSTQSVVICDDDMYTRPSGIVVNTTGAYFDTLSSYLGCDSIIETQLTVLDCTPEIDCNLLCNTDFEEQQFTPANSWTLVNQTDISCWGTTAPDGQIEVWGTGFNGVPAYSGSQFIELNANHVSTLYQDFVAIPGSTVTISFAHRGRSGVDVMSVEIGPVGGPYVTLGHFADDNIAWGYYTVNYTFPNIPQINYSLRFNSISAAGGNQGVGNFLDAISITMPPMSVNNTVGHPSCPFSTDGSVGVEVSGGTAPIGIVWNTPLSSSDFDVNGLGPGEYSYILTDRYGCRYEDTLVLTAVLPYYGSTQNVSICRNETYALPGGAVVSAGGTYIDTLQTVFGCDSIVTTNLTLRPVFGLIQDVEICANKSYTLPGGVTVNTSGTYTDTLTAQNGCDSVITTNLTANPIFSATQNVAICANESYTLPGGMEVNTSGIYVDTLSSIYGCDSVVTTNLTVNPVFSATQNVTICANESYALPGGMIVNTAGSYTDTLNSIDGCDSVIITHLTANPTFSATQNVVICANENYTLPGGNVVNTAGTYTDVLQAENGCDSVVTTILTVNPIFSINIFDTICAYQMYTLPSGEVVSAAGTYIYTFSSVNVCDSVVITSLSVINLSLSHTSADILCNGESTGQITVSQNGGLLPVQYLWSNAALTGNAATGIPAGSYSVTATDAFSCTASTSAVLTEPPALHTQYTFTEPLCYDEANATVSVVAQGGVPPYSYSLNNYLSDTGYFSGLQAGMYQLIVTDNQACSEQHNIVLTQPDEVEIYYEPAELIIELGQQIALNLSANYSGSTVYAWEPPSGLSCTDCSSPVMNPNTTTHYTLTVTTAPYGKDCVRQFPIAITVYPSADFYVPNAFSPNGNNENDEFRVFFKEKSAVKQLFIKIFNRWGEKVFEANDVDFAWDGRYKGHHVPPGVYVYQLNFVLIDNTSKQLTGGITVIR